ncbi:DUF5117 domain-containing protein [Sphingomonas lacunae]|uniref:DUF5117 domain-containing protein n=1 Tax=Sphingomonas lacunae TaxID=2698828 RepID=A0A6M4AVS8_9SPHN|nr:zinc-dependent metalloprotease [Sphingomonas lacunae]QJQ33233.1 DUF5117 domain-containing protein [Sphingomonas lacunae]
MALALCASLPASAQSGPATGPAGTAVTDPALAGTTTRQGLLPVHVDPLNGRVLITLPAPDEQGLSGRYLYTTQLRTGIGSASLGLDRAQFGPTQLLAFRRIGGKLAIQFENPRFRATGGTAQEQAAARNSFAYSTVWLGDIVWTRADGSFTVDITAFLSQDVMGIGRQLGNFRRESSLSVTDAMATRVFPDNLVFEALQSFVSDNAGAEITNIAPDARVVSVTVRHSLVRLPAPGYVPRRLDPRGGAFGTQVVDYGAPLGQDIVYDLANRFRLEKTDPTAARSTVVRPITFYIDRAAPEPIRSALADGVRWWAEAFDRAGFVDAFRVDILPEGADPLDVRYNVVNWVNRATRGWSYGQTVTDPRTGEIVRGSVLLGSLRVRQDILIYESLVGTAATGQGGPNDPAQVALARIRQLGAHEVGHALGIAHNFAASTQDRASVMDYPAPRILLSDGVPDLSDAYGVGTGAWDHYVVDWLYADPAPGTADPDAHAAEKATAAMAAGLRFVADGDGRGTETGHPHGAIWDDFADPAAELTRMMEVRRVALARFGTANLRPGEPMSALRRRFVPLWLLHRYQTEAAAKLLGGVQFPYAVNGEAIVNAPPVPAGDQQAALDALFATLDPAALTVPSALVPLMSGQSINTPDRQTDIEVFASAAGHPVFDPLVATDSAARLTLANLLAPARLHRLYVQHQADRALPGLDLLFDRLEAHIVAHRDNPVGRRIAWRALAQMAAVEGHAETSPEVMLALDARFARIAAGLARGGSVEARNWGRSLATLLASRESRRALLAEGVRTPAVPPGMPIGSLSGDGWAESDGEP